MSLLTKAYSKAQHTLSYLQRDAAWSMGLNKAFYKNARGSRILIYHGICLNNPTLFNNIFITLQVFEKHLQFYKEYCNVVSLDDYYNGRLSKDRFNICISFDDGFANNYKYVLPLLEKYKLPACFFINGIRDAGYDILWNDLIAIVSKYGPKQITYNGTHYIKNKLNKYVSPNGETLQYILRATDFTVKARVMDEIYKLAPFKENRSIEDYWLQMTAGQIQELSMSEYVTIGDHSYYHNDLQQIPLSAAKVEMARSKKYLEQIIQKEVTAFAFPYGAYTREVVQTAKNMGYSQLLAMDFHYPDDKSDSTMRERLTINPFVSTINQMHANITGNYK